MALIDNDCFKMPRFTREVTPRNLDDRLRIIRLLVIAELDNDNDRGHVDIIPLTDDEN
jgi:hypothetical protein